MDELFQNDLERARSKNYIWNQLTEPLYTSHETVGLYQNSFAFRMFKNTIDRLIDTGVMGYLSNEHYTRKRTYYKVKDGPKVLGLDDVGFGFNIWFGFCCLSTLMFVIEIVFCKIQLQFNKRKSSKVLKFAKIYPMSSAGDGTNCELN